MTKTTPLSCVLHVLPWVLVTVGALLFVVGLSWRNLSSSDTANAPLVIIGVIFAILAGALSCASDRPPLQEEPPSPTPQPTPPPEKSEGQVPFVSI